MSPLLGRLRGWFGQDVARTNAAQASVRLKHQKRQRQDLDAYLSQHLDPPLRGERPAAPRRGDEPRFPH
jgi:hypothetical protein